jgi:chitinase
MRLSLSRLVFLFLFLFAVAALPGHSSHGHHSHGHSHLHRRQASGLSANLNQDICLPIPSVLEKQEDLAAKVRSDTCQPGEHVVSAPLPGSSPAMSSLMTRQAEDPYACSETKKCGNHACCGKTGNCGYGPLYCGTNGESPNDVCWSNCDAKARYAIAPPDLLRGTSC